MGRRHWHFWTGAGFGIMVYSMLMLVCLPLELRLWNLPQRLVAPSRAVLACLAATFVLNAWIVDRNLVRKTPPGIAPRRGLRTLRGLLGGLPFVGLWVLSDWQRLLASRPDWALRDPLIPPLRLTDRSLLFRAPALRLSHFRSRWLMRWIPWLWLPIGNFLVLLYASLWLANAPLEAGFRQTTILVATFVLHVFGLLAMALYQWQQVRHLGAAGWRRAVMLALPLCWLLPVYFVLLGMVLGLLFELEGRRSRTLTWTAFARTSSDEVIRLADLRSESSAAVRDPASHPEINAWYQTRLHHYAREPTLEEHKLASAVRLKTLLLGLDGMALGWLASRAAPPSWHEWLEEALLPLVSGILFLVCLSWAWAGYESLRAIRRPTEPSRGGRGLGYWLALGLISVAVGLYLGVCLERGAPHWAGGVLALAMLFYIVGCLATFHPLRQSPFSNSEMLLWALLFLALLAAGLSMALDETLARELAFVLILAASLVPIWHVAFAAGLGGWILQPFSFRELWQDRWPLPLRRRLRLLAATLALPLGGLAVPYWIYLRQKSWPGYRRLWCLASPWRNGVSRPRKPWRPVASPDEIKAAVR